MVYIYTPYPTPRMAYTFNVVFGEVLGVEYQITDNKPMIEDAGGDVINYSATPLPRALQVIPSGLLSQKDVREIAPLPGKWDTLPVIFSDKNPDVPFDIFSAVFFLVTRYEEYLPFDPDQYGRFAAENSISFKYNLLRMPVVDLWCKKLAEVLKIESSCNHLTVDNFREQLTIDIDIPWMYKNRGLYSAGTLFKDLVKLNISGFMEKYRVIAGHAPDPADNYQLLSDTGRELKYPVNYFILLRSKGEQDNNRSVNTRSFRQLVRNLDKEGIVGIHPSFHSNRNHSCLKEEIDKMSEILNRNVTSGRQHFLILKFPETYRNLIKAGIKDDFSMGYSSRTGFRAGIARPYNFYDVLSDKETELRIHPFQVMDRTLLSYLNLTAEEAISEFDYYREIIRTTGGRFTFLWHNGSIGDSGEWCGWKKVFLHSTGK
jgi:hypothetical protein